LTKRSWRTEIARAVRLRRARGFFTSRGQSMLRASASTKYQVCPFHRRRRRTGSQLPPKRPRQDGLLQPLQFRHRGFLCSFQCCYPCLNLAQVGNDTTLFGDWSLYRPFRLSVTKFLNSLVGCSSPRNLTNASSDAVNNNTPASSLAVLCSRRASASSAKRASTRATMRCCSDSGGSGIGASHSADIRTQGIRAPVLFLTAYLAN
jgi:hypothetical protein